MTWFRARPHFVPCVVAGVMSLLALAHWPYDYYQLLRLIVTAAAVVVIVVAVRVRQVWAAWTFGFVALLFNPIATVHLGRPAWSVLNVLAALIFLVAGMAVRLPLKRTDETS